MARTKKKYANGQSRGKGVESMRHSETKKNYHRKEVEFHGGEMAYDAWVQNGRRGYGRC